MSNQITNPLQSLLAQAAKALPARTGEMDEARRRHAGAGTLSAIVCDCSGSMDSPAWGGRRKIDLLREAVNEIAREQPDGTRLIPFSDAADDRFAIYAKTVSYSPPGRGYGDALPEPSGGTAMHFALNAAGSHRPLRTLVISDGQPDDEGAALAAAGRLTGTIDVLYIGPDSDKSAMDFMRRLARVGGGRVVVNDVGSASPARPALSQSIRGLLT